MATKGNKKAHAALAAIAWRLMFDFLLRTSPSRDRVLAEHSLTPNDARALWGLDETIGRPIGALARDWGCDPSYATQVVDRLEHAGLAERQADSADRRVKRVVLSAGGRKTRDALLRAYQVPPAEFDRLNTDDLNRLAELLGRLG